MLLHQDRPYVQAENVHSPLALLIPVFEDKFKYQLTATATYGMVSDNPTPNAWVPVDKDAAQKEGESVTNSEYLQLILWENLSFGTNSSAQKSSNLTSPHEVKDSPRFRRVDDRKMPDNVKFDLSRERSSVPTPDIDEPFSISEEKYIVTDDDPIFKTADDVEFWVVAIRQIPGNPDEIVSNPITFVVKIDHGKQEGQGAALYAGVIVVVICIFALLIPFTVRAKRRLKQGKPVCACGSSSKSEEKRETSRGSLDERQHDQEKLAAMLNEAEMARGSVGAKHETIQSQAMKSTSQPHLQPHWRDPHYNSTYERPAHYTNMSYVPHTSDTGAGSERSGKDKVEEKPSTSDIRTSESPHMYKF
ncbi:hypothetical protein C0Q70_03676 [Pomacea canaliculata]|uniref:Uncharacterized protein n=1 Tax=Pomacea canaliculata TaxID=400727 RepID=A0A2T7PTH9_POMCA|nr:hypothetical protein C0Q70_03676 [Pomacea canaliculata]